MAESKPPEPVGQEVPLATRMEPSLPLPGPAQIPTVGFPDGSCFLCFKTEEEARAEAEVSNRDPNDNKSSVVSLQNVFRYLEIDVEEIYLTTETRGASGSVENNWEEPNKLNEEVKVVLCKTCEYYSHKFAAVYRNYDKVKLELDYHLGLIQKRIERGKSHNRKKKLDSMDSQVASELRGSLLRNCKLKDNLKHNLIFKIYFS